MAKGGRGRPKKVVIAMENTHAEEVPATFEIGEGSQEKTDDTVTEQPAQKEDEAPLQPLTYKQATIKENVKNTAISMRNRGMTLDFVAPTLKEGIPIACLDKSETEKEARKWETAVILYVIGESPTITYLGNFLEKQCLVEKPVIYYHNDDYFVIRFGTLEDRDRVLYGGPHTLANRPVIVKKWEMDFSFEKEILREIPLWVQLPKLPLNCWSGDSLSRIGSVIGKPLCADECTTNQTRISYARLMIQVDVTQPLKYSVPVEGADGKRIEQKVLYEWVPPFCKKCKKVGHMCKEERMVLKKPDIIQKQQWRKKPEETKPAENLVTMKGGNSGQKKTDAEGWSIPKTKTATPTAIIPVGNLQMPTRNSYQVMEDVGEDDKMEDEGGDHIPFGIQ